MNGGRRWDLAGAALLAPILAAAVWLHSGALRLPFFADDYLFLDQARLRSLPATLASADPLGNFFRPIGRQLYFWLLGTLSGETPFAFHLANLLAFLLIIVLLFVLGQRVAGRVAGLVAAGVVALHYAADVPLRWASGGQDLLAVAGAIAAILLHLSGLAPLAGLLLLLALLSKETVLLTPLIAVVLARRHDESWPAALRRAWPLFGAVIVWAVLWVSASARLGGAGRIVEFSPAGPLAALAHFAQVLLGLEWPAGGRIVWPGAPELIPLLLVGVALGVGVWRRTVSPDVSSGRARALRGGLVWLILGALPVAAAVSLWSAYYYLFALCGAALAIGVLIARSPAPLVMGVVLLLGATSQIGRGIEGFSTAADPWNTQSRINRFYVERSMRFVSRYLGDLRGARPTLPEGSTVFFSGVPGFTAWQTTDGPIVRWAYRDSSLRSYFLTSLTLERVRRGPAFFFIAASDSLVEVLPENVSYRDIGTIMLLDGKEHAARDAWTLHGEAQPADIQTRYQLAMMQVVEGDTAGARRLDAIGVTLAAGPVPELEAALGMLAAGDTLRAWQTSLDGVARHAADPGIHALLADISLASPAAQAIGIFEAWLVHRMAPGDLPSMRRWAGLLARLNRYDRAASLLEQYLAAGGEDAETNAAVQRWLDDARRRLPGGDLAAEGLRNEAATP